MDLGHGLLDDLGMGREALDGVGILRGPGTAAEVGCGPAGQALEGGDELDVAGIDRVGDPRRHVSIVGRIYFRHRLACAHNGRPVSSVGAVESFPELKSCQVGSSKGRVPMPVWPAGQFAGASASGFSPTSAP